MEKNIKTINVGGVNCFLVKSDSTFVLIDTGVLNNNIELERELAKAGCKPGNLQLVILTHGDFDHSGNAAYIREKFKTKIAMHIGDIGKVEYGNQSWGNKDKPDRVTVFGKFIILLSRFFVKSMNLIPFKPDLTIDETFDLSIYDLDAQILYIPGHTKGSIGVLTVDGNLFCGDLYMNMIKPDIQFFIDDLTAAKESLNKLKSLTIKTVYPGHGKPFQYGKVSNLQI
ncbi:MAG: hypothetical protein A2452_10850 [Candidatus Firestonebacteria bacterium RIFOXYC2_FULL_39_67]|nr:MAG: hypothetical protein A2536_08750 [Candidatus Firestonebacteria bacterium RIFOXYD2_FULL_39_29]OGF55954.1 MAG: hypothetical protein A2452_10850 [Candidatus Firestonebacteria bacterium RIFOXYC2_FULL_39_67]OGF56684.1 MAG: hypothetical protein A2497_06190 [Candidatus Firestonebacteria bacterium RifOxyC12_full_39_7]